MSELLDCRGLACPQPVLRVKTLIEASAPDSIEIVVDNEPARENVSRFLGSRGYRVTEVGREGALLRIKAAKSEAGAGNDAACEVMSQSQLAQAGRQKVCVFISADRMGRGDDTLGEKLMFNFVSTLPELGEELWRIILVNAGVSLATEGHSCLEKLKTLAGSGVSILVCGTCLDHFKLLDKKRVGETTNMLDVVTSLALATKVIQV